MPTVRANEMQLYFEVQGNPDDPALLLVAGHGAQLLWWHPELVAAFVDRGFFVIRLDNRDVGLSTHLDGAPVPNVWEVALGDHDDVAYRIEDMADDAAGLLDALGVGRAHVLGISLGGMVVQSLAIRHPDAVASLTSVMSTPAPLEIGRPTDEVIERWLEPSATTRDGYVQRTLDNAQRNGSRALGIDAAWLADYAGREYDRSFDPDGVDRQLAAVVASTDRRPGLRGVVAPTLVVHGAIDPVITLSGGEATAEAVPGARLVVVDQMGHDLPRSIWPALVDDVALLSGR